jgi:hypothetical protein
MSAKGSIASLVFWTVSDDVIDRPADVARHIVTAVAFPTAASVLCFLIKVDGQSNTDKSSNKTMLPEPTKLSFLRSLRWGNQRHLRLCLTLAETR